ncbi:MAG TPA: DsbE family thiol:disulfide interchange protein [Hellea balneolensis]|uniref:DsbE family thiol:disulfide interchange protein n=1 Tax=Hellea balneolensis TaxID=287478 RepID=A0A7C5R878_9PROT|nr:DsbE family thiol:disulfide interchange protein [Hellea balneolensis]
MKLKALIPLLAFLALAGAFALGLNRDPKILPSVLIDKPFPAFQLTDLYDETEILDRSLVSGRVSLVNVFGSWCVACVQEHPTLLSLSRANIVPIIGIDWRDTRPAAKAWLARAGNPYTKIIFDPDSQLAIDLGVTGAPESFIVDKSGRVRYKYTGVITPSVWERELRPIIEELEQAK